MDWQEKQRQDYEDFRLEYLLRYASGDADKVVAELLTMVYGDTTELEVKEWREANESC